MDGAAGRVELQEQDVAPVAVEERADRLERDLHPGRQVVRVEVVHDHEAPEQLVIDQLRKQLGSLGLDELDDTGQPRAVELGDHAEQFFGPLERGRVGRDAQLLVQLLDPVTDRPEVLGPGPCSRGPRWRASTTPPPVRPGPRG